MSASNYSITSAGRYLNLLLSHQKNIELPVIPHHCTICFIPDVIELMKDRYTYHALTLGVINPMQLFFFYPDKGSLFAIARGQHGAPMAVIQLEELIALGFSDFLVIGPAGHPTGKSTPELQLGDLLLPTRAWIFEGTSAHYESSHYSLPASHAVNRLVSTFEELDLQFRQGEIATTDALYRETTVFVQELLSRHILALEMELSALFTVAHFYNKSLAGALFISDLVRINGDWDIDYSSKNYSNVVWKLMNVVQCYVEQL